MAPSPDDEALADEVAERAAGYLGLATVTDQVTDSARAAVAQLRALVYPEPAVDPPLPLPGFTDAPDVGQGLVALTTRIYQDPRSPAGVLGSDAYVGPMVPEDLLTHVHHYFDRYRHAWGIG